MLAVKGIYDGEVVRPVERVVSPPNVGVVVVFPQEERVPDSQPDLMQFAGCLRDCPALQSDLVAMQRSWRDEWE